MTLQLPVIQYPLHVIELPSTGEELTIRPFVSKEEKLLLMASAVDDAKEYLRVSKQIIENCVIKWTKKCKQADELTVFDVEWLMLQLRIISVGEESTIHFKGVENSDCEKCRETISVDVNLKEITVPKKSTEDKKIMLTETNGLTLKFLTLNDQKILLDEQSKIVSDSEEVSADDLDKIVKNIYLTMALSIESFFDESGVVKVSTEDLPNIVTWLEELPKPLFEKIEAFINSTPQLEHEIKLVCSKCGKEQVYTFKGLESFFV